MTIQKRLKAVLEPIESWQWQSMRSRAAIRTALAVVVSFFIGYFFNFDSPHWIAMSAFLVCQASSGATIRKAGQRIFGTICSFLLIIALISWFDNQPVIMFCIAILISTFFIYYMAKSGDYFWTVSMITLTIIITYAASGPAPVELMTFAIDRVLESSLGSALAVLVILLMPDYAFETVLRSNQEMLAKIKALILLTTQQYSGDTVNDAFNALKQETRNLLAQQLDLRSQCAYEKKGYHQPLALNEQLERVTLSVLDLVGSSITHYDRRLDGLKNTVNLAPLFVAEQNMLDYLSSHVSDVSQASKADAYACLESVQNALNAVVAELSQARDSDALLEYGFDVRLLLEKYVLMHQKFILLMRGLYMENEKQALLDQPKRKSFLRQQINLFGTESFYWSFAFKSAVIIMVGTFITMSINLGASAGWIVVILSLRLFTSIRAYWGFVWGYLLGIVLAFCTALFGLQNFMMALAITGLVTYILAYMNWAKTPFMTSLVVSAWIGFVYTVFSGANPMTVADFSAGLEGYYSAIFFMIALYLCNKILPSKKEQLLQLSATKIQRCITTVKQLLPQYQVLSADMIDQRLALASHIRHELNAIRAELDKLGEDYLGCLDEKKDALSQYLEAEWHRYYALADLFLCFRAICLAPTIADDVNLASLFSDFSDNLDKQARLERLTALMEAERARLYALKQQGAPVTYASVLYAFDLFSGFSAFYLTSIVVDSTFEYAYTSLQQR